MVFIKMFHGRKDPAQQMDDWGLDGPVLGPYQNIHVTYTSYIKLIDENGNCDMLRIIEDMIYYAGCYYGDWIISGNPKQNNIEKIDPSKA
ncbi:hypothetical protein STSP2_01892 [Anaerohalosphaera lusitana]|uniref:Uncharacterized protein n=1 Tax=Anaerohalosphaera lusitana TaxID=1936003 RepID=A0A1U9NMA1_9BACT|nr:hypothetical protein [Anaerohalosphaera lusitana]AQT68720.1 hypothetical protein STSP2_01892 [Anaerohalosphaera lusitana]